MDDLVSREWLLKHMLFEVDMELVRKAPNAEKHGEWVGACDGYRIRVLDLGCKDCGCQGASWMRYCPGCGRVMD